MLKKSHRVFAISFLPIIITPISKINYNVYFLQDFLNDFISKYNLFYKTISNNNFINIYTFIFVIFYFIGSTLPDVDLKLSSIYGKSKRFLYHRQYTHSFLLFLLLVYLSFFIVFQNYNLWISIPLIGIALGIFTHLIGDMLTGSIPILFYGSYYKRFTRIGITTFLPKFFHTFFTKKLPLFLEKYYSIFFVILFSMSVFIRYLLENL